MNGVVSLTIGRADLGTAATEAMIAKQQGSPASHEPPEKVRQRASVLDRATSVGWPCYELTIPDQVPVVDLVYLHGGAYIAELSASGWRYAMRLATDLSARVIVPIYPLAPASTATRTVGEAAQVIEELIAEATRPVLLLGDSAGGGLALAATIALRDAGRPLPGHLAMQAPWFDVALENPGIPPQLPLDRVLNLDFLAVAAKAYAGDLPYDDPRVSPIRADLRGLPPITLHVGTRDLALPDARDFTTMARAAGVAIDFHEVPGQVHAYWVLPIPEARRLRHDLRAAVADLAGFN
jgi:acetyl esterase/lipase